MLKKLFIFGVIAIPFTGIYPLLPIGELQNELSVYIFIVVMGLALFSELHARKVKGDRNIKQDNFYLLSRIMVWTIAIIGLSFLMNFVSIIHGEFRGRSALDKFSTSTLVVIYGFGLAYLSYFLGDKYSWHEIVIWPIAVSVAICGVVAGLEMMAWYSSVASRIYDPLSQLVHGADLKDINLYLTADMPDIGRARSVTFEPPSLANFAGFAWPWVYTGMHSAPRRKVRPLYFGALIICTLLIIVSWSRTTVVLLSGNIIVLLLLRFIYLPTKLQEPVTSRILSIIIAGLTIMAIAALIINGDAITNYVVNGDSVSNITRFASMMAGFRMFPDAPLWGHGFGQYGFYLMQYLPDWGFSSWEIAAWVVNPAAGWPPVFCIYARLAAELGIIGLVLWPALWVGVAWYVYRITLTYQRVTGQMLLYSYPLIISCYCTLLAGISLDSVRTPMMWITLGLACCYIHDVRSRLKKPAAPAR